MKREIYERKISTFQKVMLISIHYSQFHTNTATHVYAIQTVCQIYKTQTHSLQLQALISLFLDPSIFL